MIWLHYAGATLFALIGLLAVVLTPIGIPGAWMLVGVAGSIDVAALLFGKSDLPFSAASLAVALGAAVAGEVLEFLASAMGARAGGASRAGMTGSIIGGFAGVIAGTVMIPIPIMGSVIGALAGVVFGAIAGEMFFHNRTISASIKPAAGAAMGRLLGSLAKLPCALIAWVALVYEAFV